MSKSVSEYKFFLHGCVRNLLVEVNTSFYRLSLSSESHKLEFSLHHYNEIKYAIDLHIERLTYNLSSIALPLCRCDLF